MDIASLLPVGAVLPHLQVKDKKHALKALAAHAAGFCPLPEKEILAALLERESVGCTGTGHGVCIPHGRFEGLERIYLLFARLDTPVAFGAADGRAVDLIFLLLSPARANTEHLKVLSRIAKLLRDPHVCATLRAGGDAASLHEILTMDYS